MPPHSYSASPKIFSNAMASANFRVSSSANPLLYANAGETFIESAYAPAQNITGLPDDSSSFKQLRSSFSYALPSSLGYNAAEGQQQYAYLNAQYPFDEIRGEEFLSFGQYPMCFDDDECDKIEEISSAMQAKDNGVNEHQAVACVKPEISSLAAVQQVSDECNAFSVPFIQQQNYYQPKVHSIQQPASFPEQQQVSQSQPWISSNQYNSQEQQYNAIQSQQPQYQQPSLQYPQQLSYPQKQEYQQQAQQTQTREQQSEQNSQHINYYNIYTQQCNQKMKSQDEVSSNQQQSNPVQIENSTSHIARFNSSCNPNGNFTQNPIESWYSQPHLETSHSHSSASSHCGDSDHHTLPLFSFPDATKIPTNTSNQFDFFSFFSNKNPQESTNTAGVQENQQICRNKAQTVNSSISSSRTLSQSHGNFLPIKQEEEDTHHHEGTEKLEEYNHNCNFYSSQQQQQQLPSANLQDNPDFYTAERKQQITAAMQQSNKKNVVRNLMRAFKQYFLQKRFSEPIMSLHFSDQNPKDVQQKFKRYFAQRKFNHNSIKQLVQHEKYGDIFHEFLKEHSQAYLKNSFVKKQELHQVFIDFLLLCFRDEGLLDHLETYSKIKNPFQ